MKKLIIALTLLSQSLFAADFNLHKGDRSLRLIQSAKVQKIDTYQDGDAIKKQITLRFAIDCGASLGPVTTKLIHSPTTSSYSYELFVTAYQIQNKRQTTMFCYAPTYVFVPVYTDEDVSVDLLKLSFPEKVDGPKQPRACTREYMPVCGQPKYFCPVGAACSIFAPPAKTYSNLCEMKVAEATLVYKGACQ
jgi:hypothetical protein